MMTVPLKSLAAQTLNIVLGGQYAQLNIYSKLSVLYMDVSVNNTVIILGVQCQNGNRIVRSAYLGFLGDFVFVDLQGSNDPTYAELGTRYILEYLDTDDLATLAFAA